MRVVYLSSGDGDLLYNAKGPEASPRSGPFGISGLLRDDQSRSNSDIFCIWVKMVCAAFSADCSSWYWEIAWA